VVAPVTSAAVHRGRVALLAIVAALAATGFLVLSDAYRESEPIVDLDVRVEEWVAGHMPAWAEWLARPFTWVGGIVAVVFLAGTVALLLLRAGHRRDACFLLAATLGVQIVVAVLKSIYGRPRPDAGSPIDVPQSTSFPSGHAATGITLFGALAVIAAGRVRSRAAAAGVLVLGLLVGVAVGASRIVLNVHFVSDVLAGLCVGLAWLCTCLLVRELIMGRSA
jgi:undecaprenyl-diphosphatase